MFLKFDDYYNFNDWQNRRLMECQSSYYLPDKKMNICVDVGSNTGAFIKYASSKFNKIFGFEASLNNCLKANAYLFNNDITNYFIHNLACYSNSGNIVKLYSIEDKNGKKRCGDASIVYTNDNNFFENVLTISLEDVFVICQTQEIDYLKLDCEGAEYNFLKNKEHLFKNIGIIALELHRAYLADDKAIKLLKLLRNFYNVHEKDEFNYLLLNKEKNYYLSNGKIII